MDIDGLYCDMGLDICVCARCESERSAVGPGNCKIAKLGLYTLNLLNGLSPHDTYIWIIGLTQSVGCYLFCFRCFPIPNDHLTIYSIWSTRICDHSIYRYYPFHFTAFTRFSCIALLILSIFNIICIATFSYYKYCTYHLKNNNRASPHSSE